MPREPAHLTYSNEEDDGAVPGEYSLKLTPIDGQSTQVNVAEMPLTIEDGASEGIRNSANPPLLVVC